MAKDILIVDDEIDICELVADIVSDEGYTPYTAHNSDAALKALGERVPSLMLLDIWLQGSELDGLGILEVVRKKYPDIPVIMISGHGNVEAAVHAMKLGAFDFIEKPFQQDTLMLCMKRALEAHRLRVENKELKRHNISTQSIVGESAVTQQLISQIEKIAPTNSRIFISGPSGVGKEMVARHIHQHSQRASAPFTVLPAAALTSDQVDKALFGIEDVSMHGGIKEVGILERTHRGTLYIDEITDMSLATQGKILRVLQEQSFERVGGTRTINVDVRVIAATSKDVQPLLDSGEFRQDLYYRLNVVPLRVPALKERRDDIPLLCKHFITYFSESSHLPKRILSDELLSILMAYEWPGNVRQLRNLMEWLLTMAPGDKSEAIHANALPSEFFESTPNSALPSNNTDLLTLPLREAREFFEKQYLTTQINRFGGNISRTAQFIGMERSALHRKLKLLGIKTSADEKSDEPVVEEVV